MTSQPRLRPLSDSEMTVEHRAISNSYILNGMLPNVIRVFVRNYNFLRAYKRFGIYFVVHSSLEPRTRELAILRILWLNKSDYEWGHHVRMGIAAGLTPQEVEAIRIGPAAPSWAERDRRLLLAVDEMKATSNLADATYCAVKTILNKEELFDFVFVVGNYAMLSTAMNVFRIEREPGIIGVSDPIPGIMV